MQIAMKRALKQNVVFGAFLAPSGVTTALFLTIGANDGDDYKLFFIYLIFASLAIFLTGFIFRPLIRIKGGFTYLSAVFVGLICGVLSHPVCWTLTAIFYNKIRDFGSEIDAILTLSIISIVYWSWITAIYSIIVALLFTRSLLKNERSNGDDSG
ncbi:MAG: hypothetical protein LBQ52_08580 [Helicobacteraceae bacterium]|jgi:hypothetical protein|nr:hypothetical protein [Helicobacteraceae bacterium]